MAPAHEPSNGTATVVRLEGEHDYDNSPEFRARIEAALDGSQGVIVDLTEATFVDSSVLGILVRAMREADRRGLSYAIAVNPEPADPVRHILELSGLLGVLPLAGNGSGTNDSAAPD